MNICSCVVHTQPGQGAQVARALGSLPGVGVHGGVPEGRLVVTIEDTRDTLAADTLGTLNQIPNVINTVLIYHYGGDDIATEEHDYDHQPA